jgi:hypothetical protein
VKKEQVADVIRLLSKITFLIVILLTGFIGSALALEFTTDERSLLHVGGSAAISATIDLGLYLDKENNNFSKNQRIAIAGTTSLGVGLAKEVALDAYIDWGDVFWDAVGAYGTPWLIENYCLPLTIRTVHDTVVVSLRVEY